MPALSLLAKHPTLALLLCTLPATLCGATENGEKLQAAYSHATQQEIFLGAMCHVYRVEQGASLTPPQDLGTKPKRTPTITWINEMIEGNQNLNDLYSTLGNHCFLTAAVGAYLLADPGAKERVICTLEQRSNTSNKKELRNQMPPSILVAWIVRPFMDNADLHLLAPFGLVDDEYKSTGFNKAFFDGIVAEDYSSFVCTAHPTFAAIIEQYPNPNACEGTLSRPPQESNTEEGTYTKQHMAQVVTLTAVVTVLLWEGVRRLWHHEKSTPVDHTTPPQEELEETP